MDLTRLGISPEEVLLQARAEQDRRNRATRYLTDPFKFQKYVICRPDRRDNLAPLHEEGLQFINQGKRKKLILWPRKHLKSTIFTQGEALRRAILDPNIRILISSAREDNAKRFLTAIKGYLRDPHFIELFGELLPTSTERHLKNNDGELTLRSRTDFGLKEPTFSCTGLDAAQTSQHYDLIIHDDVVERKNVGTIEMIEKVITYFKDSLDLLDPGKELWVIGTRWHPLDLYGWIMECFCDPRCVGNDFEHVDRCNCDFDVTLKEIQDEYGNYIFPNVFDAEEADELLRQKGQQEFAAQYKNNPYDPSVCWFRLSDIEAAIVSPEKMAELRPKLLWYVLVDPAESEEKRSALTAAVAIGVDPETGIWYVDRADGRRVNTVGFIEMIFDIMTSYRNASFGIETNTRKGNVYILKEEMNKRGVYFTINDLSPMRAWAGGDVKVQRIKRLQPLFEFGRIKIRADLRDLIQAATTAPAARSLDLLDALAYGLDLIPAGIGDPSTIKLPRRAIGWAGTGL